MIVSEMTVDDIKEYLRLDETDALLTPILAASKAFVSSYTGLTDDEIDEHEDFPVVIYVLCQDMYDNRRLYVDKGNLNKVVDSILGMHSTNLLPTPDEDVTT